jgi:hypothetical protein
VEARSPSGSLDVVWVDTSNVQTTPSVQVDTKKSGKNSSVKVSTKNGAAKTEKQAQPSK